MKKLISMAIVCMMLLASVNVMAATNSATLNLGGDQVIEDRTQTIVVPVNIAEYSFTPEEPIYNDEYTDYINNETIAGVTAVQLYIAYNPKVLSFTKMVAGTIKNASSTNPGVFFNKAYNKVEPSTVFVIDENTHVIGLTTKTPLGPDDGIYTTGALAKIQFTVAEGVAASDITTQVKIYNDAQKISKLKNTNPLMSTAEADITVNEAVANITLKGEEIIVPEVPEKSTVKTFPKLYWNAEAKELTTVGVIFKGLDFDTIKYGINIEKGEGTVNYWAADAVDTDDATKAFYAIKLGDINDEETDIKSTSAAKAILDNGTEAGAAVTATSEGTYADLLK